ncbi:hypothetical protein H4219_003369 [Mycoemilia scoparia]|uniref:Uncharacterized protein n=1 Tax=Mycoemilia scoparia TaxID=417184 RepID=A0A9W8DTH5_9FUNG|nr:hypothetical protein H4219_003369 [Mycoemilia scoparia]
MSIIPTDDEYLSENAARNAYALAEIKLKKRYNEIIAILNQEYRNSIDVLQSKKTSLVEKSDRKTLSLSSCANISNSSLFPKAIVDGYSEEEATKANVFAAKESRMSSIDHHFTKSHLCSVPSQVHKKDPIINTSYYSDSSDSDFEHRIAKIKSLANRSRKATKDKESDCNKPSKPDDLVERSDSKFTKLNNTILEKQTKPKPKVNLEKSSNKQPIRPDYEKQSLDQLKVAVQHGF